MIKRGRPKKESGVRGSRITIRLTDEEMKMIKELAEDIKTSKGDVIRRAIKMLYSSRIGR